MDISGLFLISPRQEFSVEKYKYSEYAWIAIDSKLYENNRDSIGPILKHEFSHIKYNDSVTSAQIGLITSLAGAIFFPLLVFNTLAIVLTFTVACIATSIFSYHRESRADNFGISHSSDKELQGYIRYFKDEQKLFIEARKLCFINTILYNPNGDERFNFFYPCYSKRIQRIENELIRRQNLSNKQTAHST